MAEEQTSSGASDALSELLRAVQLSLTPIGGRVFLHSVSPDNLDRTGIELRCEHHSYLFVSGLRVVIGDQEHKPVYRRDSRFKPLNKDNEEVGWKLDDCEITLQIYEADDDWVAKTTKANDGNAICGRLSYRDRIKTDDGVVNEKRPPASAWIGMGPENYRLLRDRLLADDIDSLSIGITVQFPGAAVESDWSGRTVKWDGKESLPILEAVAVCRRKEWDHDDYNWVEGPQKDEEGGRFDELYETKPYEPPREQVELMGGVRNLERRIEGLHFPLWIAVIALIVIAVRLSR